MRIAMIGTGYVGLVSGACLSEFGHEVVCIDKDMAKVRTLRQGADSDFEPGLDEWWRRQCQGRPPVLHHRPRPRP